MSCSDGFAQACGGPLKDAQRAFVALCVDDNAMPEHGWVLFILGAAVIGYLYILAVTTYRSMRRAYRIVMYLIATWADATATLWSIGTEGIIGEFVLCIVGGLLVWGCAVIVSPAVLDPAVRSKMTSVLGERAYAYATFAIGIAEHVLKVSTWALYKVLATFYA